MHNSQLTYKSITAVFFSYLLVCPLSAAENENPWYIGIGFGGMKASGYAEYYESQGSFYSEDGGSGLHIFFGYDLPSFSIEYSHGGFSELNNEFIYKVGLKVEYDSLTAMKGWPLGQSQRFWGYGRAGIYQWEVRERVYIGGGQIEEKATGISPMLGIGMGYGTQGDMGLRLELDYFSDAGDGDKVPNPISSSFHSASWSGFNHAWPA